MKRSRIENKTLNILRFTFHVIPTKSFVFSATYLFSLLQRFKWPLAIILLSKFILLQKFSRLLPTSWCCVLVQSYTNIASYSLISWNCSLTYICFSTAKDFENRYAFVCMFSMFKRHVILSRSYIFYKCTDTNKYSLLILSVSWNFSSM